MDDCECLSNVKMRCECVRCNDEGVCETDHASDGGAFGAAPAAVARARPCAGAAVPPLLLSG